jgi:hypothetical protein
MYLCSATRTSLLRLWRISFSSLSIPQASPISPSSARSPYFPCVPVHLFFFSFFWLIPEQRASIYTRPCPFTVRPRSYTPSLTLSLHGKPAAHCLGWLTKGHFLTVICPHILLAIGPPARISAVSTILARLFHDGCRHRQQGTCSVSAKQFQGPRVPRHIRPA